MILRIRSGQQPVDSRVILAGDPQSLLGQAYSFFPVANGVVWKRGAYPGEIVSRVQVVRLRFQSVFPFTDCQVHAACVTRLHPTRYVPLRRRGSAEELSANDRPLRAAGVFAPERWPHCNE